MSELLKESQPKLVSEVVALPYLLGGSQHPDVHLVLHELVPELPEDGKGDDEIVGPTPLPDLEVQAEEQRPLAESSDAEQAQVGVVRIEPGSELRKTDLPAVVPAREPHAGRGVPLPTCRQEKQRVEDVQHPSPPLPPAQERQAHRPRT